MFDGGKVSDEERQEEKNQEQEDEYDFCPSSTAISTPRQ